MMKHKKLRRFYAIFTLLILFMEIMIALWVRDAWIRPYGGDILVTVLLCCMVRILFPNRPKILPLYVLIFAALVELAQWFDLLSLTGLNRVPYFSLLMGSTFSVVDLICYAIGCALFYFAERWLRH